jgi:hypothetical protein
MARDLLHFVGKFEDCLVTDQSDGLAWLKEVWGRTLAQDPCNPVLHDRETLSAFYRNLAYPHPE